jgi:hypothetical protein
VRTDGHGVERQRVVDAEQRRDPLDLGLDLAATMGVQTLQHLDGDVDAPAGAALVPGTSDGPVDEHDREIAGLAANQRTLARRAPGTRGRRCSVRPVPGG